MKKKDYADYQLAVVLDLKGKILRFLTKPDSLSDEFINKPFRQLVGQASREEFDALLNRIPREKMIVTTNIAITYLNIAHPHLICAQIHNQLLLIVNDNDKSLYEQFFREILIINNEHINTIRELQKQLHQNTKKTPDTGVYEQLISTNNELANIQRQLAKKNIELENALKKVKLLSGLIPICANCKRIRDDRGYWNQVEKYIAEHSEAQFSHGLCPDCMRELYPDFVNKKESRNKTT